MGHAPNMFSLWNFREVGRLAQLVEQRFYTAKVRGSSPLPPTLNELNGFERNKEWALRSNAHAVSPVFAKEFKEF